jgi:hypothetical protein
MEATNRIVMQLPVALAYMSDTPPDPERTKFGTAGWYALQEAQDALMRVDSLSRPWLTRRRRAIRRASDELSARLTASWVRSTRGAFLNNAQRLAFPTEKLHRAVFGTRSVLDERINELVARGLPEELDE